MNYDVLYDDKSKEVKSIGAETLGLYNLKVKVEASELIDLAKNFIIFVMDYQKNYNVKITSGETLSYGFWLVKFIEKNGFLDVLEMDTKTNDFIQGAEFALRTWGEQRYICEESEADFLPPSAKELITLSKSILEEESVIKGVRLEGEIESSGWLHYRDEHDLNHQSAKMITVNLYDLVKVRPDLICFFALPFGFRFEIEEEGYDAWFDEQSLI